MSPERAGSLGVDEVVDDHECTLACSGRDVSGDTLYERLDLVVVVDGRSGPQQRTPFDLFLEGTNCVGH